MRWLVVLGVVACGKDVPTDTADTDPIPVLEGPEIEHTPPDGVFVEGQSVLLQATADDPDGVDTMDLFFRVAGDLPYRIVEMDLDAEGTWFGEIDGEDVRAPGIEYYLRAYDRSDFRVPADHPFDGPDDPLAIDIAVVPVDVPYVQGFEETTTAFGVYEVGWTEYALAFRGERWTVDAQFGSRGGVAFHGEGYPGIEPVDDWLVSPVLDFSGLESAEVRFSQYGERTEAHGAHSLWISTGATDPELGEFVKVMDLPPAAEGRWESVPVIDLSAWAGEPSVALAWRYEGGYNDVWAVDDVRIRRFGPDLQLVSAEVGRLDPGTAAPMTVTITNGGAPTEGPIDLSGAGDTSRVVFPSSVVLPALQTGETASVALPLEVALDHPDNTPLPVVLTATDGVDTASWPVETIVGDRSRALFRLQTIDAGIVRLYVGSGNPALPHAEEVVFLGNAAAGVHSYEVDLTDHVDLLPSAPGRLRWWARVETSAPGNLLGFGIDFDGSVMWTDDVGAFPVGTESMFYLPARAEPVFEDVVLPEPVVPGEEGTLSFTLANRGGPSTGTTRVSFAPSADLALSTPDLVLSGPEGWSAGAEVPITVPFTVAGTHTDSSPVSLSVTVFDDEEQYAETLEIGVPWPSVVVGGLAGVREDTDVDGVFEPQETAILDVTIRNDGALATQPMTCTMVHQGGPNTEVLEGSVVVGVLDAGAAALAPFRVRSVDGVDGSVLSFNISCSDGLATWTDGLVVDLGGGGWTAFPLDPVGDAAAGAPADLRQGRWRVDGDNLTLDLTSATPIDLATLQLEVWGFSAGSTWTNHLVTVDNGVAELYGERFGGLDYLSDVDVLAIGDHTIRLTLDIPSMELAAPEIAIGFGTGFCPTGDLYCDHWPDGWGNPYGGVIDTTIWFLLTW